ncbi:hypothetical protein RGL65_002573 [Vibrio parahaemolyticus]|nr:hypothetical protein [Vibrio parahaemolyticus]
MKKSLNAKNLHNEAFALLISSWELIMDCLDLMDPKVDMLGLSDDEVDEILNEHDDYIKNNRLLMRKIATSLVVVQQSAEIFLKAALCEINSDLIFTNSNGKTVDSSKLIKLYNHHYETNIDPDFARKYGEMRQLRNDFTHLLSYYDDKLIEKVLDYVLHLNEVFGDGSNLINRIANDDSNTQMSILLTGGHLGYSDRYNEYIIHALNYLKRSKIKRYFGIDVKEKMTCCDDCDNCAGSYETSQIINGKIRCLICHP